MLGRSEALCIPVTMLARIYCTTIMISSDEGILDQTFVITPVPPILILASIKTKQPRRQVQPLNS